MKNKKSAFAEVAVIATVALLGVVGYFFVARPILHTKKAITQQVSHVKAEVKSVGEKLSPAQAADEVADEPAQEGLWISIKSILTLIGVGSLIAGVALAIGIFFGVFHAPYPTAAMLAVLGTVVLGGLSILTFLGWLAVFATIGLIVFAIWHWATHHATVIASLEKDVAAGIAGIETDAVKLWSEICFLWGKVKASIKTLFAKKPTGPAAPTQTPPAAS